MEGQLLVRIQNIPRTVSKKLVRNQSSPTQPVPLAKRMRLSPTPAPKLNGDSKKELKSDITPDSKAVATAELKKINALLQKLYTDKKITEISKKLVANTNFTKLNKQQTKKEYREVVTSHLWFSFSNLLQNKITKYYVSKLQDKEAMGIIEIVIPQNIHTLFRDKFFKKTISLLL